MHKESITGPSYWDVETFVEQMRQQFNVGTRFEIFPPHKYGGGSHRTSWRVVARVWRLDAQGQNERSHDQSFGRNGAWGSLPAAMHACLRNAWDVLEEERQRDKASRDQMDFLD